MWNETSLHKVIDTKSYRSILPRVVFSLSNPQSRWNATIGLPIATETPEEIAVSIMAEVIDVRRQKAKPRVKALST